MPLYSIYVYFTQRSFSFSYWVQDTAQKTKIFIIDLLSKCDQIRSFLRIWWHLLNKSLMKNFFFFFCSGKVSNFQANIQTYIPIVQDTAKTIFAKFYFWGIKYSRIKICIVKSMSLTPEVTILDSLSDH